MTELLLTSFQIDAQSNGVTYLGGITNYLAAAKKNIFLSSFIQFLMLQAQTLIAFWGFIVIITILSVIMNAKFHNQTQITTSRAIAVHYNRTQIVDSCNAVTTLAVDCKSKIPIHLYYLHRYFSLKPASHRVSIYAILYSAVLLLQSSIRS